jgi:hypothetical protein
MKTASGWKSMWNDTTKTAKDGWAFDSSTWEWTWNQAIKAGDWERLFDPAKCTSMWGKKVKTTEEKQIYDLPAEGSVAIEVLSGDLEVIGWDQEHVVANTDDDESASVHLLGSTMRISPDNMGGSGDLTVHLPRWAAVSIRACNGDVSVTGIDGDVQAEIMNGDLDARQLRGRFAVRAFSGDVKVAESRLAGISVESYSGDCNLETSLADGGSYHVHSLSGDVDLQLPEDQKATLSARLLSGDAGCHLPHELRNERHHSADLVLNGGGVPFQLRLDSGDLTVRAAGHLPEAPAQAAPSQQAAAAEPEQGEVQAKEAGVEEPFSLREEPATSGQGPSSSHSAQVMAILKAIEAGEMGVNEGLERINALQ